MRIEPQGSDCYNRGLIVELKSIEALQRVHAKQVLTQLRLGDLCLGYLINFGEEYLKDGIKRLANRLKETP